VVTEKARAKKTLELSWIMLAPKLWLAVWCVVLGLIPALGITAVQRALDHSRQGLGVLLANANPLTAGGATGLFGADRQSVLTPLTIAAALGLMFLLARTLAKLGGSTRRQSAPWLCGYARETEQNRYQSRHFYGEIQRYFGWASGAGRRDREESRET
jgi:hypothetical protein